MLFFALSIAIFYSVIEGLTETRKGKVFTPVFLAKIIAYGLIMSFGSIPCLMLPLVYYGIRDVSRSTCKYRRI